MNEEVSAAEDLQKGQPWYSGITRYQWLVLVICSLGWVFDIFEGQIFVASMNEAMPAILPPGSDKAEQRFYINITFGAFLLGGALGGVFFGILSDRIGRKRTMTYTILMYSLFTCFSAFSQSWWHMAGFRFLVAMGVGGEWAVASALVAEVFPKRARAWSLGIFHASSVFGTYLAIAVGWFIIGNESLENSLHNLELPSWLGNAALENWLRNLDLWRIGFLMGVLPALLIIWVRLKLHEPKSWEFARRKARDEFGEDLGKFSDLFTSGIRRKTIVGFGLATVGMATFWGAHIYGKDLLRRDIKADLLENVPEGAPGSSDRNHQIRSIFEIVERQLLEERNGDEIERNTSKELFEKIDPLLQEHSFAEAKELLRNDHNAELYPRVMGLIEKELLAPHASSIKRWEMLGMFLVTTGGGLGLICFGPLCERIGRRGAFLFFHLGGFVSAYVLFGYFSGVTPLLLALPIFGFLTLGMHAGYAIYFPELFPTRIRSTGAGFCFNMGRVLAAPILFLSGWLQLGVEFHLQLLGREFSLSIPKIGLEDSVSYLSGLFLLGVLLLIFAPETKGKDLPE